MNISANEFSAYELFNPPLYALHKPTGNALQYCQSNKSMYNDKTLRLSKPDEKNSYCSSSSGWNGNIFEI